METDNFFFLLLFPTWCHVTALVGGKIHVGRSITRGPLFHTRPYPGDQKPPRVFVQPRSVAVFPPDHPATQKHTKQHSFMNAERDKGNRRERDPDLPEHKQFVRATGDKAVIR